MNLLKRLITLLIVLSFNLSVLSQTLFHSDIYNGGVTTGGLSSGMGGEYTDSLHLHIPAGSTIKKVYLFIYSAGEPIIEQILINGNEINIDTSNYIMNAIHTNINSSPIKLYAKDLTNSSFINLTGSYSLKVPGVIQNINDGWFLPILYIEYENPNMFSINTSIWINNQDYDGQNSYNLSNMNPINSLFPVGLSIFEDRACSLTDGTIVNVNGNNLGTIGGSDLINFQEACGGAKGHFYYENQTLYGLDDDVPNNSMNGTDALADISSYLTPNSTGYNLNLEHVKYPSQSLAAANLHLLFINAYTSPCSTFTTSVTSDTTICFGETLQLLATGGVPTSTSPAYEWTSLTNPSALNDLSCTDCPNPIFSGTSSQVYTVRIWNTDSCSVVKPISIGVSQPQEIGFKTFRSICSFSTGQIVIEDSPDNAVQIGAIRKNGDTLSHNSSNVFNGLSAGDYTLFYIDNFGCSYDTLVTVEPVISTVAQFNANPKTGTAPIQINLTNQSKNATDYSWWINDAYQGSQLPSFYADTSGIYEIELIAWRNDSICVDTFAFTVFIFDSLIVGLPNVFTPNNDGVNDFFNIKVNLPVTYNLVILNRWGNVVFENEDKLSKGTHKLWNGDAQNDELVNDGVYFYKISFELDDAQQCNCSTGVNCEITNCEVVSEGFVQVYGEK